MSSGTTHGTTSARSWMAEKRCRYQNNTFSITVQPRQTPDTHTRCLYCTSESLHGSHQSKLAKLSRARSKTCICCTNQKIEWKRWKTVFTDSHVITAEVGGQRQR